MPNILRHIGDTPLVRINKIPKMFGVKCEICEYECYSSEFAVLQDCFLTTDFWVMLSPLYLTQWSSQTEELVNMLNFVETQNHHHHHYNHNALKHNVHIVIIPKTFHTYFIHIISPVQSLIGHLTISTKKKKKCPWIGQVLYLNPQSSWRGYISENLPEFPKFPKCFLRCRRFWVL